MNFLQLLFSVKNSSDKSHKIWTILGLKLKFKHNTEKQLCNLTEQDKYRFIELNKLYFKVRSHWFWERYDKQGWEPQTYNTYQHFLTENSTYVDIGAWVGTTIFFAAELGVKNIYGVEANPLSYELVNENCSLNKLTKDVCIDNICITDKDNVKVGFGGLNNEINTSSASNIRGNQWQIQSKTLISYLKEKNILDSENLFIKIDIEGAEELILEDLKQLKDKENVTIYLSIHPPFMNNKNDYCKKLLDFCFEFKNVFDSNLNLLDIQKLEKMILTEEQYPAWGTKFGNFFEITLSNFTDLNYKNYWTNDNLKNIKPNIGTEFPEGWDPVSTLKQITSELCFNKILDFGCGYGRLSKAFDDDKYVGIDLNPKALALAKKNNPSYSYIETTIDSSLYPSADLCVAYTVFLHLDDDTLDKTMDKLSKTINKNIIIAEILGREWRRNGLPPVYNREKEEYVGIMNKYGYILKNEIKKPYMRYVNDSYFSDKKNTDLSFLIFEKGDNLSC